MVNQLSLIEMAAQIRSRAISPVELVEAHLAQIEKHNPALNAFVLIEAEEARAAARTAEQKLMDGAEIGPLHGVPVTVKDSFDIAGLPTTCGSRLFQNLRARTTATPVVRLIDAGAIILGKTNCPEFLASYETDNFVVGRSNNPWDLERTPGGSSGGEACAIAAFMSAGGIGSDGGGSIRVPAHFTGIVGLKPTPGRVPATGHMPAMNHPSGLMGVAGPMARTAGDVRALFEVLQGFDPSDPFSAPVPLRRQDTSGLRVGVMEQFPNVPVRPEVREAVIRAAKCLESMGYVVEEFRPEGIDRAPNLWWFFFGELPARITQELIAGRESEVHWTGTESLAKALSTPEPSGRRMLDALAERDRLRCEFIKQMGQYAAVVAPVCGVPAFRHRERRWQTADKTIGLFEAMMPSTTFNLLGLPGLSVPFGQSPEGLPVGVQLVGRPFAEELLLDVSARLEEGRGLFPGPPAMLG